MDLQFWQTRFRLPAWEHQLKEFDENKDRTGRMLRWQMRTGKTKAIIDLTCYRYELGPKSPLYADTVIIAAPNNVHANWPRKELPKHMWEGVRYKAVTWDTTKSRNVAWERDFFEALEYVGGILFICVNAEAFGNPRFKEDFLKPLLKKRKRIALVADETHNLSRRTSSKKSVTLRGLAKKCVWRRGLSGTITENSPLHAFGQYELVEPGCLGYTAYGEFERHFAEYEDLYVKGRRIPNGKISGYKNQEELRELIAPWTSVVLREDCHDLPDVVTSSVTFGLTPEQRRLANALTNATLARLDGGELIPPKEAGSLVIALQQIASGWILDEDGEVHDIIPPDENPRLEALRGQLSLCGPKAVIWCRYREDIVRVYNACKAWGFKPVHYYGGTAKKDRAANEDRFQRDPTCGPMIGQPKACSEGLEFSAATDIIWYSHLHGDLIARRQADERATKVGGERIFCTDLVAIDSTDEPMLDDQAEKGVVSEFLTGEGLRRYLRTVY